MHPEARAAIERMIDERNQWSRELGAFVPLTGLDLGGQDVNGGVRDLFGDQVLWDVLDIEAGPGVTIVGDATSWRPGPNAVHYDVVLTTETLEHVQAWPAILETAAAVMTERGTLFVTCASTSRPAHGATGAPLPAEGEWYQNVVPEHLKTALDGLFEHVQVDYAYPPGDAYAWAVETKRRNRG